ncbi:hypothetical protein NE237_022120 [Protea cynaroides]|uniref:Uncharacterized protein n=1 Tax=Protea cynaroides TaxID=273540 RepID=A0A9Q0H908_9MAGN|nr:hypothetical protein NE237_022120 [Protea cynaroides]
MSQSSSRPCLSSEGTCTGYLRLGSSMVESPDNPVSFPIAAKSPVPNSGHQAVAKRARLNAEQQAILQIQLSLYPSHDRLVWTADKSGKFSVKSAYHLITNYFEDLLPQKAASSRIPEWRLSPKSLWKCIWVWTPHEVIEKAMVAFREYVLSSPRFVQHMGWEPPSPSVSAPKWTPPP